jgi:hypothetical protein
MAPLALPQWRAQRAVAFGLRPKGAQDFRVRATLSLAGESSSTAEKTARPSRQQGSLRPESEGYRAARLALGAVGQREVVHE